MKYAAQPCNCIDEVNKMLAEMDPDNNTRLDIPFAFSMNGIESVRKIRVSVVKRDEKNRRKPIPVEPAYCPFCGKLYPDVSKK